MEIPAPLKKSLNFGFIGKVLVAGIVIAAGLELCSMFGLSIVPAVVRNPISTVKGFISKAP